MSQLNKQPPRRDQRWYEQPQPVRSPNQFILVGKVPLLFDQAQGRLTQHAQHDATRHDEEKELKVCVHVHARSYYQGLAPVVTRRPSTPPSVEIDAHRSIKLGPCGTHPGSSRESASALATDVR